MLKTKTTFTVMCLAIFFAGLTPRIGITSVGLVAKQIGADLNLSESQVGLISSIPLLCFGLFSGLVPLINKYWGYVKTIYLSLLSLFLGFLIRFHSSVLALYLGTLIIGLAITLMNISLPAYIKHRHYLQAALLVTIYSVSFSVAHALSSNFTLPITHHFHNWRAGMNIWLLLVPIAIAFWFWETHSSESSESSETTTRATNKPTAHKLQVWKNTLAWQIALFFGLKSILFYSLIAWLPKILQDKGIGENQVGGLISLIDVIGLPITIFFSQYLFRTKHPKLALTVGQLIFMGGLTLLLFTKISPFQGVIIVLLVGAGMAINGVTGYSLPLLKTNQAIATAKVTAMAQSIGFTLAAIGPTLTGKLHSYWNSWENLLVIGIIICVIQLLIGYKIALARKVD